MRVIYKFKLNFTPFQQVLVPSTCEPKFLCVKEQNEHPVVYIERNTHENTPETTDQTAFRFVLIMTGFATEIKPEYKYADTIMFDKGRYVVHVYRVT